MKNIIIAGPSRSGKSTLARLLNEKFGYYVISIDKLVAVFGNAYPELDIRLNWNRDKTAENIAPFLAHYLGMFSSSDGRGLLDYSHGAVPGNKFVLEGAYLDLEKISAILKDYGIEDMKEDFHLIGLVQHGKSAEGFYNDLKRYDTPDDWTYNLSDDELRSVAADMVEFNGEMFEKLQKHGFDIYDTSKDRDKIFDEIIANIAKGIADA